MSTKQKVAERDLLRLYNIAFTNTEANPVICSALSVSGYDAEQLVVGKNLLYETENLYRVSLTEREKQAEAYELFRNRRNALDKMFNLHRRLARVAFRRQKLTMDKLAVSGCYQVNYSPWIATAAKFYSELAADPELLRKISRFGVTEEDIRKGHQMVEEVTAAYAFYVNLKGESQKTTQEKRAAFERINDWMRDFYAVARITFQDQPQQFESFGIVVKS